MEPQCVVSRLAVEQCSVHECVTNIYNAFPAQYASDLDVAAQAQTLNKICRVKGGVPGWSPLTQVVARFNQT